MSAPDKRIDSILCEAIELSSEAEREAFLQRACGSDNDLRRRVDKMVNNHFKAGDFLEVPAVDVAATANAEEGFEKPGVTIDRYKLLQVIGEGGFGVVYMAEQVEPVRRRVALKIIKPGMDTKAVIARFEAERQALALMDHSNIARVFDGGTTSLGRPYFVMELVKGVPLTEFCDQNKLSTSERLDLFADVCHAVQHAHQKGVIHRDLKPSNIMVTLHDGKPVVKIIDFGVAKAINQQLTEKTLFTGYGQMIGTLQYMSPEQAEMSGIDVDTRCDVYSLGVVLYELLTGTTPVDEKRLRSAGYAEMQRLIREEDAPSPSVRISSLGDQLTIVAEHRATNSRSLSHLLRGELDWIVLKALAKDRKHRYETAREFGLDIRRHLAGEAVIACPPKLIIKVRTFMRRNRLALACASLVLAALLLGLGEAIWRLEQSRENERRVGVERDIAEREELRAEHEREIAVRAKASLRRKNYAYSIGMAFRAWQMGSLPRLNNLLMQQIPDEGEEDLRGFEWRFLRARYLENFPSETLQFESEITSVAYSPNGKYLAIAANDGRVTLRECRANYDFQLVVPDTRSKTWTTARNVAFSLQSDILLVGGGGPKGGRVRMWRLPSDDSSNGRSNIVEDTRLETHDTTVGSVAISPAGDLGVGWSDNGTMLAFHLSDGETQWTGRFPSNSEWEKLTFSPSGELLAIASEDCTVSLCKASTGEVLETVKVEDQPGSPSFSPDGQSLIVTDCTGVRRWCLNATKLEEQKPKLTWRRSCSAFSPDGRLVALGGNDDSTVRILDLNKGERPRTLMHEGRVATVAFSPDGNWIASGAQDKKVKIWRVSRSGRSIFRASGKPQPSPPLAVSSDSRRVALADENHNVVVWDFAKNTNQVLQGHESRINTIAFSPTENLIASSGRQDSIRVWDLTTGSCKKILNGYENVTFSPDGRLLAATRRSNKMGSTDQGTDVTIWSVPNFDETAVQMEYTGGKGGIRLTFSPNGQYLASARRNAEGSIQIWDDKGRTFAAFNHLGGVQSIAFSPNGELLASAGDSSEVKVWNLKTREHMTLEGYGCWFTSVAFSPNGKSIVAVGPSGEIRFWRAATGEETGVLSIESGVRQVLFTPDGNGLVWASMDGDIEFWSATPESEL